MKLKKNLSSATLPPLYSSVKLMMMDNIGSKLNCLLFFPLCLLLHSLPSLHFNKVSLSLSSSQGLPPLKAPNSSFCPSLYLLITLYHTVIQTSHPDSPLHLTSACAPPRAPLFITAPNNIHDRNHSHKLLICHRDMPNVLSVISCIVWRMFVPEDTVMSLFSSVMMSPTMVAFEALPCTILF